MQLKDILTNQYGWYGEFFSKDKRFCRIDIYRGKSAFVPFRLLSRIFMKNRAVPVNDIFSIGKKVTFSNELIMDDVFSGCVFAPPLLSVPPDNISKFPFNKKLEVSQLKKRELVVKDIENGECWGISHMALTTPLLIEIND